MAAQPDSPRAIALDGLGTDARPGPEIDAAISAAAAGLSVELVGDRARLAPLLEGRLDELGQREFASAIELVDAPDEIAMDESPARAVKAKPESSLCRAVDRVKAGAAGAMVSAGNSGAVLAAALFRLGRLPGIERPAIVANLPQLPAAGVEGPTGIGIGPDAVLLDAGANVDCSALNLVQFAVLGATWSRAWHGIPRPRVAILSNGHEPSKGTAATREAHRALTEHGEGLGSARSGRATSSPGFEFVGYIEANALFAGHCDVIVTDGWTGNVALKLAEGAMAAWPRMLAGALAGTGGGADAITSALAPALRQLGARLDPDSHGGAPLLGVDGPVILCHGAAGPKALHAALQMAHRFAEQGVFEALQRAVAEHRELFELVRRPH
jgi:phosphate acyltransferase